MKKEIKYDKIMNIRLADSLLEAYKNHCDANGFLLSKRIRFLIQKDIEGKIKIIK